MPLPKRLIQMVAGENLLNLRAQDQEGEDGETPDIADLANQIAPIKALLTQRNAIQTPASIKIDLTPRESVLNLVTEGLMNKEIARRLQTSVRNVEKYVSRLFSKRAQVAVPS